MKVVVNSLPFGHRKISMPMRELNEMLSKFAILFRFNGEIKIYGFSSLVSGP